MEPVFIYIVGAGVDMPPFKVGVSTDPAKRLRGIQTGSPIGLAVLYTWRVPLPGCPFGHEKAIHRYLAARRRKGEWFHVPFNEIAQAIETQLTVGLPKPQKPVRVGKAIDPVDHRTGKRRLWYTRRERARQAYEELRHLMRD